MYLQCGHTAIFYSAPTTNRKASLIPFNHVYPLSLFELPDLRLYYLYRLLLIEAAGSTWRPQIHTIPRSAWIILRPSKT